MNDPNHDGLEECLKPYSLDDVCCALADKFFNEAEALEKAGYKSTAIELERLANIVGNLFIPRIPTVRETPNKEVKP